MAKESSSIYASTVFACETSSNDRYIRCDFNRCSKHNQSNQQMPEWLLNTPKNVKILEQHVSLEVFNYVKAYESASYSSSREVFESNTHLLKEPTKLRKFTKIIACLNLRDQQAELGLWTQAFLEAASTSNDSLRQSFCMITLSFASRWELLKCVRTLSVIREACPKSEVMVILSCHSSNQGQVFSCTPTYISSDSKFEEFCSLHDFVRSCHDALGCCLKVIHISSCFTLKLDDSLVDWPVHYSWYRKHLKCILSGSTKEIYETGSQVADLYLILSVFMNQNQADLQLIFDTAICKAADVDWPDLANEMGLSILDSNYVDEAVKMPAQEDKVTPPGIIFSPIHVILIAMHPGAEQESCEESLLSNAILQNLRVRKSADLNAKFSRIWLQDYVNDDASRVCLEDLIKSEVEDSSREIFFVFIGRHFAKISPVVTDHVRCICMEHQWPIYGMHFQDMTLMTWKSLSKAENTFYNTAVCSQWAVFPISGLLNITAACVEKYPLLLYLIHLAIGENGLRRLKKIDAGVKETTVPSKWTLVDVYMETSFVLSGLSMNCDLNLISNLKHVTHGLNVQTFEERGSVPSANKSTNYVKGIQKFEEEMQEHITNRCNEISQNSAGVKKDSAYSNNANVQLSDTWLSLSPIEEASKKCCKRRYDGWEGEMPKKVLPKKPVGELHGSDSPKISAEITSCRPKPGFSASCSQPIETKSIDLNNISSKLGSCSSVDICNEKCQTKNSVASNSVSVLSDGNLVDNDLNACGHLIACISDSKEVDMSFQDEGKASTVSDTNDELNCTESNIELIHAQLNMGTIKGMQSPLGKDADSVNCDLKQTQNSKNNLPKEAWGRTEDLPLMANVDDVLVKHYILDLDVDFKAKVINGTIILFLKPARADADAFNFQMCLDSTMVTVEAAEEITVPEDLEIHFHDQKCCCKKIDVKEKGLSGSSSEDSDNKRQNIRSSSEDCCGMEKGPLVVHKTVGTDSSWEINGTTDQDCSWNNETSRCIPPTCNSLEMNENENLVQMDISPAYSNTDRARCHHDEKSDSRKQSDGSPSLQKGVFNCKHCQFLFELRRTMKKETSLKIKKLAYSIHGWCIRIWKEGNDSKIWPRCVKIWYRTSPEGQSIMWAKDQDGNDSVFTPGAYINNRSLMPCQEPPVAMSTWQAYFRVKDGATVLMSGDRIICKENLAREQSNDQGLFYYEMSMPLPCSTLALSVGCFEKSLQSLNVIMGSSKKVVPVTMYASKTLLGKFTEEFQHIAYDYLLSASQLLGEYPFNRLDLVLMPRCFACMGLESPNLAFLSQSLLCGDQSMSTRIAHEISHAWFGLLVGVKDWTEEWLSEGFATYLEERIQAKAENISDIENFNRVRLRQAIRYRSLQSELSEAEENLKSLRPRPSTSGYVSAVEAIRRSIAEDKEDEPTPHTVIHGALIPSRKWTQVHYLKGYFLLCHLAELVGLQNFDSFLLKYIDKYRECLVTSEMFFSMFADEFEISLEDKESLMKQWLETVSMPKLWSKTLAKNPGFRVLQVNEKFQEWKRYDTINKRCKTLKQKRKRFSLEQMNQPPLCSDGIILLLEKLIEKKTMANQTLKDLQLTYSLNSRNAEIRHRWCELIVKHRYAKEYDQIRRFLIEDQGMGIYLFGELLISQDKQQKKIAEEVFQHIKDEMDVCTYQTVYEMLNGI